jgi:hypothetical protein
MPAPVSPFSEPAPGARTASLRALVDSALAGVASSAVRFTDGQSLAQRLSAVRAAPEGDVLALPEQPWFDLATRLGATDLEIVAGFAALLAEVDPVFTARLRAVQGDGRTDGPTRPTLGLLVRMLGMLDSDTDSAPRLLARLTNGAAVASGVVQLLDESAPLMERAVQIHAGVLGALLETPAVEGDRIAFEPLDVELIDSPAWHLPSRWNDWLEPLTAGLRTADDTIWVLRAHDPLEARGIAARTARLAGWRVAAIRPRAGRELTHAAPLGLEPWLLAQGALPLFEMSAGPESKLQIPEFRFYRGPVLVAAARDGELDGHAGEVRELTVPMPTPEERAELWQQAISAATLHADLARWRCGVAALHAVSAQAARRASVRGRASPADLGDARTAHVAAQVRKLGSLAQPVNGVIEGEGFVVAESERAALDLLRQHCLHREVLLDTLGDVVKARAHPGVKALFVGASGTGKTLAAQWLAHDLGKPLLRVDAAAVTSKYIGETEKHLSQLLSQAEHLDCVLLFDEADALFGSRTDVSQANDRFANAQTNYLLTRIESFDGIAILTSNSKSRFDDAFIRRLDAIVEFRLPRAEERRRLWCAHLGSGHDLTPEELNLLAADYELAGGHIRNAVLGAALHARGRDPARINFADVRRGLATEYQKLGRALP